MKQHLFIVATVWYGLLGCQTPSQTQPLSGVTTSDSSWRINDAAANAETSATLRLWVSLPQHTFVGQGDFEQLFVITEVDGSQRLSRAYAWQGPHKPLEFRIPVEAGTTKVAKIRQIVSEDYLFVLSSDELKRLPGITLQPGTQAEARIQLERNQPF